MEHYQDTVKVDWDLISKDLLGTIFAQKFEMNENSDRQRLQLHLIPWREIVPEPNNLKSPENFKAVVSFLQESREERGLMPIPSPQLEVNTLISSLELLHNQANLDATLFFSLYDYCMAMGFEYQVIRKSLGVPRKRKLMCWLGIHDYENNPSYKETMRQNHVREQYSGIQKGIKTCRRCGHQLPVFRQAAISVGCFSHWKPLSEEFSDVIGAMPKF